MILDDELVQEALGELEKAAIEGWRNSRAEDAERREDAWRMLRTLDVFKDQFERWIAGGMKAAHDLEFQKKQQR